MRMVLIPARFLPACGLASGCRSLLSTPRKFVAWTDSQHVSGMIDVLYRADAAGHDVTLALGCLIAQARVDQSKMSACLAAYYRNNLAVIDGEWEEVTEA